MIIAQIRHFNRYYSRILGVFNDRAFDSSYSMIEMRMLGEIARHPGINANQLACFFEIDKGYLSRVLNRLQKDSLITKQKDSVDKRVLKLYLTSKGNELNDYIDQQSNLKIEKLLDTLTTQEIKELQQSMLKIENLLTKVVPNELEEK